MRKIIVLFLVLSFFCVCGCFNNSLESTPTESQENDEGKTNAEVEIDIIEQALNEDLLYLIDPVMYMSFMNESLQSEKDFESCGYNIDVDDVLIYSVAAGMTDDKENGYRMLEYAGYKVDRDNKSKSEDYVEALIAYNTKDYKRAYYLFSQDIDFVDCEEKIHQMSVGQLVVFEVGEKGPAGGYIFYDKGSYSDGWRYLEAASNDLSGFYKYGGYGTKIGNTWKAVGTGMSNTEAIINRLGSGTYAAKACSDYSYNGYDDWFLPSRDELNLMYTNLHEKGIGNFKDDWYWSSSEYNSSYAWYQYFDNGNQGNGSRDYIRYVRPIRRF